MPIISLSNDMQKLLICVYDHIMNIQLLPSPVPYWWGMQVQEELELANLAKMFLLEQIKKECWSGMAVKGKVVKVRTEHNTVLIECDSLY